MHGEYEKLLLSRAVPRNWWLLLSPSSLPSYQEQKWQHQESQMTSFSLHLHLCPVSSCILQRWISWRSDAQAVEFYSAFLLFIPLVSQSLACLDAGCDTLFQPCLSSSWARFPCLHSLFCPLRLEVAEDSDLEPFNLLGQAQKVEFSSLTLSRSAPQFQDVTFFQSLSWN